MVTWSFNCLVRISTDIISYKKLYNYVETNDYYHIELMTWNYRAIGLMCRVFANGLGDLVFNPRLSHTKDSKMVIDTALINTQHYKVWIRG